MPMKIAVPDLISNSYFPAVAAVALGFFEEEGLEVSLELIFPVDEAYRAMRDGRVDFVAGSAHSALAAFPQWQGVKLLCAQAQGMYWFLVMHRDLGGRRGDIGIVKGRSIGAAPWVDIGLRRLLIEAGIDLARDNVKIAPVPPDPIPVLIGGHSDAALRRAARLGDGWLHGGGDPADLPGLLTRLARFRHEERADDPSGPFPRGKIEFADLILELDLHSGRHSPDLRHKTTLFPISPQHDQGDLRI